MRGGCGDPTEDWGWFTGGTAGRGRAGLHVVVVENWSIKLYFAIRTQGTRSRALGASTRDMAEDALTILMRSAKQEGVWNVAMVDDETEARLVEGLERSGEEVIDNSYEDVLDLVPENSEAPEPLREPMQPSEAAQLSTIDVHLHDYGLANDAVVGLVLWYADGSVQSIGRTRGTTCSTLELDEYEYIIRLVTRSRKHERNNCHINMIVETSNGRTWSAKKYDDHIQYHTSTALKDYSRMRPQYQVTIDQEKAKAPRVVVSVDYANARIHDVVAPGMAVWSVGFNENRSSLGPVLCKPLESFGLPSNARGVPRLMALARPVALQALRRAAAELDQAFEGEVRELTSTSRACATSAFRKACTAVRDSAEANEVRRLRHELAAAEAALEARREYLNDEAWERVSHLQATHDVERESIADRRCVAQKHLLKEQQMAAQLAGVDGVLCASIDCRKPFDPKKALRAQCDVDECASVSWYCGCTFRHCRSCLMSLCHIHAAEHDDECEGWMRCGYVEYEDDRRKGRLHPECCNKLLDEEKLKSPKGKGEDETVRRFFESPDARTARKKRPRREAVYQCYNCNATVCEACCQFCQGTDYSEYMYSGRACLKVWCNACTRPTAQICESCCEECSFHHGNWF